MNFKCAAPPSYFSLFEDLLFKDDASLLETFNSCWYDFQVKFYRNGNQPCQEILSGLRPLSEQYNIKGIQANDKQTPKKTGGNFDSMNIYYVFGTKSKKKKEKKR